MIARVLPDPGELLHFSEDPSITRFVPHVAATSREDEAYVWTVDALNSPCYWFPRQCPRACSWVQVDGRAHDRVQAVEEAWLEAMGTTRLYAYRFAASDFEAFGERPHAHVARREVSPLGPAEPVGDLVGLHRRHGIELRVLPEIETHFAEVVAQGREFSGIRMGNVGVGPGGPFATRR